MFHQDQQQMVETTKLLYTLNSMETVKWIDILSHEPGDLRSNRIYNLLVSRPGFVEDIRCRVISFNATTVLIFKLKDE